MCIEEDFIDFICHAVKQCCDLASSANLYTISSFFASASPYIDTISVYRFPT